jgi:uncharacterized protein (TIGR02679 family)
MSDRDGGSEAWWCPPELRAVWGTLADRLERRGLEASGRVVLSDLTRAERHCLADLLGRPVNSDRVTVDLEALDARLRERAGRGVVVACAEVVARPLVDRRAAAAERQQRAEAPRQAVLGWLAEHPDVDWPWVEPWLARLRSSGALGRDDDAASTVTSALDVLWSRRLALSRAGSERSAGPVARTDLAAVVCHDAHALDDDRRLAGYVLRAVAEARGRTAPDDAASRRDTWAEIAVLPDSVSATCLVWRLSIGSTDIEGRPTRLDTSAPFHLTWWHVRGGLRLHPSKRVLVCENPRVLEAVAEEEVPDLAVVCTSGRPNLTTQHLLSLLAASRTRVMYHGDFDWPGVAMANDAVTRWTAAPLLMSARDYEAAPGSLALRGPSVEPSWDPELGAAMRARGVAVHEEAVLEDLLAAL